MVEDYALTLTQGSYFTVLMNIGGLLGVLFAGAFGDRIKKNVLYLSGYAVLFICMFAVGGARGLELLFALFFLLGFGSRVVDTLANPLITENYPEGSSRYLNIMHMSISVGGLTGPVALRLLMDGGIFWQGAFRFLSGLCFLLFIAGLFLVGKTPSPVKKAAKTEKKPVLLNPFVLTASLMIFCYSGHQIILNTWSSMYMEEVFGTAPFFASLSTTCFWAGIAASRLIGSRIVKYENARALVRGGAAIGAAVLTVAVISPFPVLTVVCFALTGLLTGAVIPILIFLSARAFPDNAGQVSGTLYLFSMTASLSFPWVCGLLADNFGFRAGLSVSAAALFILLGLSFWNFNEKREESSNV